MDASLEKLVAGLPDAEAARRFLEQLAEKHRRAFTKLMQNAGLLSDVVTIVSFSPLLATTLLQHPDYISWLERKRAGSGVVSKDDLLESLARFALTNSQLTPQVLLARFRRRELLRIYLRDIRRLATITEITEEISNLADAVLEYALAHARRDLDNRFGTPLQTDAKGRARTAGFCIVSLGKLGSRELNYASDIDLLFIYSSDGTTSGQGSRGTVSNREYFVKLVELTIKIVGEQTGEGAAYRVDLRLRPHGRVGALAMSLVDTVRYYRTEARDWERQVLIRSRGSAGEISLAKRFFRHVEDSVFAPGQSVDDAVRNVRLSKEKIDLEQLRSKGFNVKLGRGGIREIEFIAQALQLAYGGGDPWLRSAHTLVSLTRLADRGSISESELTELFEAYDFLRHLEHILQMENGLQTHTVPENVVKRTFLARQMGFTTLSDFESGMRRHTGNVRRIFDRIFGEDAALADPILATQHREPGHAKTDADGVPASIRASLEKSTVLTDLRKTDIALLHDLGETSPHFTSMYAANPQLLNELPDVEHGWITKDYREIMSAAADSKLDFAAQLSAIRRAWSRSLLEIAVFDVSRKITMWESKRLQTELAEASIDAALEITRQDLQHKLSVPVDRLALGVLALGKLGGGGMDYESDLDIVLVYDDTADIPGDISAAEFYGRAAEIFITVLSGMTRDGSLYRVDLRLRPYGKNGPASISAKAFCEYMSEKAAVWELLAFVKIRGVGGERDIANNCEAALRSIIHERAHVIPADELKKEAKEIRLRLERSRAGRRGSDVDIKYGSGGMLDVYFAMRFLQLRDDVRDGPGDRSTTCMLDRLLEKRSLSAEDHSALSEGYQYLSALDHQLRLTIGRSTRLPSANTKLLNVIARRLHLDSANDLFEKLTLHRINIRIAFDRIL